MTLQQCKLAIEAANAKSISIAAESLNIAQSNASQSLKKLEAELGFAVFTREGNGIKPTDEGARFLEHAKRLLKEDEAIHAITAANKRSRLRVGVTNYGPPIDAFIDFCAENKDVDNADYLCINTNADDGVMRLKERSLDIVVTFLSKAAKAPVEQMCREAHMKLTALRAMQIVARVSKDHPLYLNGTLDGSIKGFNQLCKYPYVEYNNGGNMMDDYKASTKVPFGFSYKIMIEERETRLRIIGGTDAYSLGVSLPEDRIDRFGLVEIPLKDEYVTLCIITRRGDDTLRDISRFIELLKEHIK